MYRRRTLEFGAPGGTPCLYFHATNSCPAEGGLFDAAARRHGVRILAVERPGPRDGGPALLQWAADAVEVADAAGLESFALAGWSAGGTLALACGAVAPRRVTVAALINPAPPAGYRGLDAQQRFIVLLCRHAPWLVRRALGPLMVRAMSASPEQLRDPRRQRRMLRLFPSSDRALLAAMLTDPAQREVLLAMSEGNARQGAGVVAADLAALWGGGGWGFDPFTVRVPLHVFAGARDTSLDFCRRLAQASPHTTLHEFPGGHHGFLAMPVRDTICAAVGARAAATQSR